MPDLQQELLPNQRGVAVYTDGVFQGYEDVCEVSDEELAEEEDKATCEEYLGHSPPLMTHPEVCFVLRCLAKKLGYKAE